MKFDPVYFDLTRFGGIRPLVEVGEIQLVNQEKLDGASVPGVPSDPSKNPLFIVEFDGGKAHEKGCGEETIRTAGDTGDSNPSLSDHPRFRFATSAMEFGDICAGWTPEGWACELRRKADRCESCQPEMAAHYRRWASDIEARLEAS